MSPSRNDPSPAKDSAARSDSSPLELSWYRDDSMGLEVRPAPLERDWMNASRNRFAYNCLPLNVANLHGWEILNPVACFAIWNGGDKQSDTVVYHDAEDGTPLPRSVFGQGLLTFPLEGLIRTEPGFDLWIGGPINRPKPHIQALSGIVETDWSKISLTVTWKITTPNELVHFAKGEPFCSFFPIQRGVIERFEPRFRKPEDDQEAWDENRAIRQSRLDWNVEAQIPGTRANRLVWQRTYLRGPADPVDPPHRMKLRLKPFTD